MNGGSGSRISDTDPRPASSRWRCERTEGVQGGLRAAAEPGDGVRIRPDEPRPDGALVVRAVALVPVALVPAAVRRVGRRERPQARGERAVRDPPAARTERATAASTRGWGSDRASSWFGRSDGSSPSGPSTTSSRYPSSGRQNRPRNEVSATLRRGPGAPERHPIRPTRRSALTQSAWISTGLPRPRGHDPVVHLRVHPGELDPVGTTSQQPVVWVHADPEPRPGDVGVDDGPHGRHAAPRAGRDRRSPGPIRRSHG